MDENLNNTDEDDQVSEVILESLPLDWRDPTFFLNIYRDYSSPYPSIRFSTTFPKELAGSVTKKEYKKTVQEVNKVFAELDSKMWESTLESLFMYLTCTLGRYCRKTRMDKVMLKIHNYLYKQNNRLYHPIGLHVAHPLSTDLRKITIRNISSYGLYEKEERSASSGGGKMKRSVSQASLNFLSDFIRMMENSSERKISFLKELIIGLFSIIKSYLYGFYWLGIQIFTRHKKLKELPKMSGKIGIVTGGSSGIGAQIVKQLLLSDMEIIIGCRDIKAGNMMIKEFRNSGITSGKAQCIHLDLSLLHSVRKFGKTFLNMGLSLNLLVNNAGIACCPFKETIDGYESQFQVNYLSHFILTLILIPALAKGGTGGSKNSRIVYVTSGMSRIGKIDFDDLLMKKEYYRYDAYANTKLLQILSSNYLDSCFVKEKVPIRCYAVHPGVVKTNLFRYFPTPWKQLMNLFMSILGQNAGKGSDGVIYASFAQELEGVGGLFLSNCGILRNREENIEEQRKLWEVSCSLIKYEQEKQVNVTNNPFLIVSV